MATFVVTTSMDVANGDVSENDLSLREAIELTNASPGADRITFADGIDYVALTDKLPTISDGLRLVGGGDVVLDANADGDLDPETTVDNGNRRALDIRGDGIAVTIDGLTITGGSAGSGAGIRSGREVDLAIVDSRVIGNVANGIYVPHGDYGYGGGIFARGDVRILGSQVERNEAYGWGGGIFARGAVTARESIIADNQSAGGYDAGGSGGGIFARAVRLVDSEVSGNRAFGLSGGGIRAVEVTVISSSVVNNEAVDYRDSGFGGGISAESVVARDSTIAWNVARGFYGALGGGIFVWEGGSLRLVGATLTGNEVTDVHRLPQPDVEARGGAIAASGADASIRNSIVAGNFAEDGADAILGATRLWSSIIRDDGRELFTDTTRIAKGIFAGNSGDNGGLTRTVALRFDRDNPAIGAADPETATATDQRGVTRDAHPDIGAFEATRRAGVVLTGTARSDVLQGSDARDKLDGREGNDLLRGLDGRDDLRGGADDDTVRGNRGKDVVEGGGGSDDIFGGRNDDSLRGGAGPDRFVFFERFGIDVIADFDARPANGQDQIDLHHLGVSAGNFEDRVTITDLGGTTLVAVQDAGAILCRGVNGEGANAITVEDFLLLA